MAKSTKPPATKSFVKSVASDPIARSVVAIVSACSRFPWTVLALAILVTIAAGYYTATHFAINTNTNEFISARLPWRQNLIALDKAFPQRVDQIVVVIDGATPELAEAAAQSLTERLKRRPDLYQSVMRPEGGPYFDQNGLLFQPVADLQRTLNGLYQARPFLMALAYDPSLRGIVKAVSFINEGVHKKAGTLDDFDRPMAQLRGRARRPASVLFLARLGLRATGGSARIAPFHRDQAGARLRGLDAGGEGVGFHPRYRARASAFPRVRGDDPADGPRADG
jgi:hypothetical protein